MADQSPTQNKLIVTVGLLAVFTLVSLRFIIGSYYISMTEAEAHENLAAPEQLMQLRAEQNKALAQSPVPIDVAMKNLATSGRDNAPALITPQQSNDLAPLQGWSKLPHEAPVFAPPPPPPTPTPMVGDGGVLLAADGGVMRDSDGGAMHLATDGAVHLATDAGAQRDASHPAPTAPTAQADAGH